MVSLRPFVDFGPRILPIFRARWDTIPFIVVMFFSLGASIHSFYVLATRPPLPSLAIAAGMIGYRLGLLGDFDMFELEGVDPVYPGSTPAAPEDPAPSPMFYSVHVWFVC